MQHLRGLQSTGSTHGEEFVRDLILVTICVTCCAFASGLTIGINSFDYTEMLIKTRSGTPDEKRYAEKILPVLKNHHLLLVSLLLWNALAAEALPIFLDGLVTESWQAIVISVTLVLFVGEIIPAAILTGPRQLQIAFYLVPLVYLVGKRSMGNTLYHTYFQCTTHLFNSPSNPSPDTLFRRISFLSCGLSHRKAAGFSLRRRRRYEYAPHTLEYTLLTHPLICPCHVPSRTSSLVGVTVYNRKEIATMMNIQQEEGGSLHEEEVNIIGGALKFRDMVVHDVMTPEKNVFMLSSNEKLNHKVLSEIFKSGYSRIPVYGSDRHDIVGLLLTKDLIFIDADDETPIANFVRLFGRQPAVVWHDQKLGETLSMFKKGRSHMAIVRNVNDTGPGRQTPTTLFTRVSHSIYSYIPSLYSFIPLYLLIYPSSKTTYSVYIKQCIYVLLLTLYLFIRINLNGCH